MMIQKAIEESRQGDPDHMSYEQLLALSEQLGTVAKGFSKEDIQSIPFFDITNDIKGKSCPICYELFRSGEKAKKMSCNHEYHVDCIDPWLEQEKNCPVCKQEIIIMR